MHRKPNVPCCHFTFEDYTFVPYFCFQDSNELQTSMNGALRYITTYLLSSLSMYIGINTLEKMVRH